MVTARFYDQNRDAEVEHVLSGDWGVAELVAAVTELPTGRGCPAAELARADGSTLSLGTDGEWAVLVWVDSLGASHHSVGKDSRANFIYDYFGSWSEAPGHCQVPLEHATAAMARFAEHGTAVTDRVLFEPD